MEKVYLVSYITTRWDEDEPGSRLVAALSTEQEAIAMADEKAAKVEEDWKVEVLSVFATATEREIAYKADFSHARPEQIHYARSTVNVEED